MKAVIDQDIIIHITEKGDTEIGGIPADKKGVGLERLRWNGEKIVDLADMLEIWVKPKGEGFFELHAIEVPGAQKVKMTYNDRKNLIIENGIIRVKTALEVEDKKKAEQKSMIENRLRARFKAEAGDPEDQLADAWKLLTLLIIFMRTGDPAIATFLDTIIPDLRAAYPFDKIKDSLADNTKTIKTLMEGYYQEIKKN